MNTAEKLIQKKLIFKAEMDKALPKAQSDALWKQATGKLDETMNRYDSLPKGVLMHTDKIFPAAAI